LARVARKAFIPQDGVGIITARLRVGGPREFRGYGNRDGEESLFQKLRMSTRPLSIPIVLVHGILGFDQLMLGGVSVADYFRLIPEALRVAGNIVPEPPTLNTSGSVAERGADLKNYLECHPDVAGKRVHLVAHSMGGLDARFMISKLDMADRVLSLTTIGTPHHGSPIADFVVAATISGFNQVVEHAGINIKGIGDLSTTFCARFNEEVLDSPNVRYLSIAGQFEPPRLIGVPFGILGFTHDLVRNKEGNNDGLVSVQSATFGSNQANWTFLETWSGSHFRLINWGMNILPTPSEVSDVSILDKYKALAERLSEIS
jgi:triacylglycerol lipase